MTVRFDKKQHKSLTEEERGWIQSELPAKNVLELIVVALIFASFYSIIVPLAFFGSLKLK